MLEIMRGEDLFIYVYNIHSEDKSIPGNGVQSVQ